MLKAIRERLRFRRWGKWILLGGIGFCAMSVGAVEATSTSRFCNSCHIMEPYYTSWKHSAHKDVECVKCHISPGVDNFLAAKFNGLGQVVDDVLHRTSTKPSASVSELSCLRSGCHTTENLTKKEVNNGRFKFGHEKHLGAKHLGVEITCGTCHSHVKGDQHFEVNTGVCITCHLIDGATGTTEEVGGRETKVIHLAVRSSSSTQVHPTKGVTNNAEIVPPATCTTCHDAPKGEIQFQGLKFDHAQFLAFGATCESCHHGVTATPPSIEDGRCLECHTFGVEKSLETKEMHKVHTLGRHKIECSSCHGAVRHGPGVQTASLETFDCTKCHVDQHMVQRKTYFHLANEPVVNGAAEPVSPMFLAHVDCTGCHIKERPLSSRPASGALVRAAAPEACDKCHQAGFGERMIPLWQKTTHSLYDSVEQSLAAAKIAGLQPDTVADVQRILDLVKSDGSWGVHNPRYTQQLLEQARDTLAGARVRKDEKP